MSLKNLFYFVFGCFVLTVVSGCLTVPGGGMLKNATEKAYGKIAKAKVNIAITPGVTEEQLTQIKKLTFLWDGGKPKHDVTGFDGNMTGILADNLTIEMMSLGYDYLDTQKLKGALKEHVDKPLNETLNLDETLKAGKYFGLQAVFSASVKISNSLVENVTLKVINAEDSTTLMLMSINYKVGKKPGAAAKSMAKIIKAKLDTPFEKMNTKKS